MAVQHIASQNTAREYLDRMWLNHDGPGAAAPEIRRDCIRFNNLMFAPSGFTGVMANGGPINTSSTSVFVASAWAIPFSEGAGLLE
jgi:hypothetical protein